MKAVFCRVGAPNKIEGHDVTTSQRNRIIAINAEIKTLRKALSDALASGAASASLSTAGNAQSYTRISPDQYRIQIASLERAKARILSGVTRRTSPDFA